MAQAARIALARRLRVWRCPAQPGEARRRCRRRRQHGHRLRASVPETTRSPRRVSDGVPPGSGGRIRSTSLTSAPRYCSSLSRAASVARSCAEGLWASRTAPQAIAEAVVSWPAAMSATRSSRRSSADNALPSSSRAWTSIARTSARSARRRSARVAAICSSSSANSRSRASTSARSRRSSASATSAREVRRHRRRREGGGERRDLRSRHGGVIGRASRPVTRRRGAPSG